MITIDDFKANTKEWLIDKLESMSQKDALQTISNLYDELHKPKYPKTIEECYEVLEVPSEERYVEVDNPVFLNKLIISFTELLITRNAYWKIAGEQMGLDKPWDSTYGCGEWGYWVGYSINENKIYLQDSTILVNHTLVFPTEEMRDAFYENFKELIEQCKELL